MSTRRISRIGLVLFAWLLAGVARATEVPFATKTTVSAAGTIESVVAADIDGDGDLDAVSADASSHVVRWHENNGATPPVWTTRTIATGVIGAYSVFAADVDRDGD